jgi:hypothetical protein
VRLAATALVMTIVAQREAEDLARDLLQQSSRIAVDRGIQQLSLDPAQS